MMPPRACDPASLTPKLRRNSRFSPGRYQSYAQDKDGGFRFEPAGSLPPRDSGLVQMFLAALSVVALLVLGIACANVANLLLAQATAVNARWPCVWL